jgi:hypothetical protein
MEINNTINEHNNCSIMELNYLRETIENMNKFNQIEVLKILNSKNNNLLNENKKDENKKEALHNTYFNDT